jgi:hypothetical protein
MNTQAKWMDINNIEQHAPLYVSSLEEAIRYYNNIYDINQTHTLPETIGLPANVLSNSRACLLLSSATERASKRTREQLIDETKRRNQRICVLL